MSVMKAGGKLDHPGFVPMRAPRSQIWTVFDLLAPNLAIESSVKVPRPSGGWRRDVGSGLRTVCCPSSSLQRPIWGAESGRTKFNPVMGIFQRVALQPLPILHTERKNTSALPLAPRLRISAGLSDAGSHVLEIA